jgi:hypothetical protein
MTTYTDTIHGYGIVAETCTDANDPERGEWLDVWVTSADGMHTNSLGCLEGEGCFDDGPKVGTVTLYAIRAWAERHGY